MNNKVAKDICLGLIVYCIYLCVGCPCHVLSRVISVEYQGYDC